MLNQTSTSLSQDVIGARIWIKLDDTNYDPNWMTLIMDFGPKLLRCTSQAETNWDI